MDNITIEMNRLNKKISTLIKIADQWNESDNVSSSPPNEDLDKLF